MSDDDSLGSLCALTSSRGRGEGKPALDILLVRESDHVESVWVINRILGRLGRQEVVVVRTTLDDEIGELQLLELGNEGVRKHLLDEGLEAGTGADGDENAFIDAILFIVDTHVCARVCHGVG